MALRFFTQFRSKVKKILPHSKKKVEEFYQICETIGT